MIERHPQSFQLDSIRFASSTLRRDEGESITDTDRYFIGKNRVEQPLDMGGSLFIPPHVTRFANDEILLGVSLGACLSNLNLNIHSKVNDRLNDLKCSYGSSTILDLSIARTDIDMSMIRSSNSIWIELSDPEPGPYFAENRTGLVGPTEVRSHKDLIHFVSLIKEIVDIPVIVSMRGIDVMKDLDSVLVTNADGIHISCGYDADSNRGPSYYGLTSEPVSTIVEAMKHIQTFRSSENGVKVLVSGPFRNGYDIAKILALGVDFVGIDMPIEMRMLQLKKKGNMDWATIGESIENTIRSLKEEFNQCIDIVCPYGINDLTRDRLIVDNYHTAALTGLPLAGYGQEIPFWRH